MKHTRLLGTLALLVGAALPHGNACVDAPKDDGFDPLAKPDASTSDTTVTDTATGGDTQTIASCTALEKTYLDLDGDGVCGGTKQCPVSGIKTCATQVTANDCNDSDATIFPKNYEPTVSGTAAKTDKKDNDCDGHTDEDDLKLVIAFDASVANGTFLNTTSTVVTSVTVKATVTVSGWVDDSGSLTARLTNETAGTTTDKTFTMKNGAATIDFGAQPITSTQIAQPFLLTIAGWDDENVGARTVLYNLVGRKVAKAELLDSAGKTVTAGTTITSAMGMAINEEMTRRMFSNMSDATKDKFNTDFTVYPAETEGVGITSKWGQPQKMFSDGDANKTFAKDAIFYYQMMRVMSAGRVTIEAFPYDGQASGLPNDAASVMQPAEKTAVTANSMTIRVTLEDVQIETSKQPFKCLIDAGCTAVDSNMKSLHDDLANNSLSNFTDVSTLPDSLLAWTSYYYVGLGSMRFEIKGMMTVAAKDTALGSSWNRGNYGAVSSTYPESAVVSLSSIDSSNDPYQEFVAREGQLAFVVAKLGVTIKDDAGNWVIPAAQGDVEVSFDTTDLGAGAADFFAQIEPSIQEIIYDFAHYMPSNTELKDYLKVNQYDFWSDWYDEDEDSMGYELLLTMFNTILARANPMVDFKAYKSADTAKGILADTLVATADHHLEIGDRVKMKIVPASSGLTAGSNYYVKDVVDARTVMLSTSSGGSLLDIKADGDARLVEGPYGAHPARFATEYDLLEHAMTAMYAKQASNESAALKLKLKETGKKTYLDQFYTSVDVLSDKSLAFTYGTRVYLPSTVSGKLCEKTVTAYQNSGQYISAGAGTSLSGTAEEVSRVRFVESMFNGGFFAAAPFGTCDTPEEPFDCNGDGTIGADEALIMKLEGRAPFVEMPSDAQGYDMVLEGMALTVSPKGSCVLSGPTACMSGQSKSTDPVDAAKTPVFLGGSRLTMRFVQPSNDHVREAEANYAWAQGGSNICHSYGSDTPLTMLNEVTLDTSGGMVGSTWAKAGCSGDALAGKMLETLNEKMTFATLNALKGKACGEPNATNGYYYDAFESLIPIGVDMSAYANVHAYCADTSEDADVATVYLQRSVSPGVAVDQVLIGGPASTQVANTAALTMTEWPGDGDDLCGDPGIDLCSEYELCGGCCPDGTACTGVVDPVTFKVTYACK